MILVEPFLRHFADHGDFLDIFFHKRLDDFIQFEGADVVIDIGDFLQTRIYPGDDRDATTS